MSKQITCLTIALISILSSCGGGGGKQAASAPEGDTVQLKYAKNITLIDHEGYSEAVLADPWHEGSVLERYLLVPKDAEVPENLPKGTLLRTPLTRAVAGTSVHTALMEELGRTASIAGVCDIDYIDLPEIRQLLKSGTIKNCGSGMNPTTETIIDLEPDALLLSPFQNSNFNKLEQIGVPVVQVADYMEEGPLGRAEWIRFYGRIFGAEAEADSIFNAVEQEYNTLSAKAKNAGKGKSVLPNKLTGSAWYVPGGKSPVGHLFADANAVYAWSGDRSTGSIPLSLETVADKAGDADVWYFHYYGGAAPTKSSMLAENPRFKAFKAFQNGDVYASDLKANLFNDETPFHPERFLRDIVIITHPGLIPGEPHYLKKIAE